MRESARWHDKVDLQLDNRQLYFLFFGTAVAACLVFTVGVLVGKRLEAGARPAAALADPLAALDRIDAVTSGRAATRTETPAGVAAPAPAPARAARGEAPARAGARAATAPEEGGLTFHRALAEPRGRAVPDPLADRGKPAKGAAARDRRAAAHGEAATDDDDDRDRDRYIVQLKALPSQGDAEALVRKLSAAGYRPYLVSSNTAGKGVTYRVRLGEFPSRRAAESAKADFEAKQRTVAYVSRVK